MNFLKQNWKPLLICAGALVVMLNFVRCSPAEAQEIENPVVREIIDKSLENLTLLGIDSSAAYLGLNEEVGLTIEDFYGPDEAFYFSDERGTQVITLGSLFSQLSEQTGNSFEQIQGLYSESGGIVNLEQIRNDTHIIEYNFGGNSSLVGVSFDGSETFGALSALSRVRERGFSPNYQPDIVQGQNQNCSYLLLSLDWLRRPAEWVQLCARTECFGGASRNCTLLKSAGSKPFGQVDFMPPDNPTGGTSSARLCYGEESFEYRHGLPELIWGDERYAIPGFTTVSKGVVSASTQCY